jgi:broad specificity phosphatase PhoE
MATTVFLVRHGVTEWDQEGRVLGQRDLPLTDVGQAQAEAAAELLAGQAIVDVVSSPLLRCVSTAERIAAKHQLQPARDIRLTDFQVGPWAGMTHDEVARDPLYQRFIANPLSEQIPGGETLHDILERALRAMEQAMRSVPAGESIAIVTHAGIIRVLLTHYLGSPPGNYHLLRVNPCSISVLQFTDPASLPRVLAVNHGTEFQSIFMPRHATETGS